MPVSSGLVSVGTAATLITTCGVNGGTLHVSNLDNTDTIFIGGATVVVNAGHTLPRNGTEDFVMYPGQQLFAVSNKATHSVSYLLITP